MTAKKTTTPKARKPRAPRKPKPEVTTTEMVEVAKISNPIAVARHMLSNAMAKRFDSIKASDLNWEAEKLFALQIIERDPKGEKAAALMNNPGAIVTCLMEVAAMGLTLSPTAGLVYLIAESPGSLNGVKMPQQLTVKVSYKGMEQSVLGGGQVIDIMTERVFTNDAFEVGRNQNGPTFEFKMARGDRGTMEGAFCFARYANGGSHLEWMTTLEIEAVKKQALTKGGVVWKGDWESEMQKKAVVRRAAKHWPRTPRAEAAMTNFDKDFSFTQVTQPKEAIGVQLMTTEHIDELDALLVDIAPNLRAIWIQRMAEALGYANVEDSPDSMFQEFQTRLAARLKVVLDRARSGVKQLPDTNEGS
jgi:recombinational DNA repair protein RecT